MLLVPCVGPLPALAGDDANWAPATKDPADQARLDLQLTLQARKALGADDALARYNLGVHVSNRTATLWGTVPTAKIAAQAERCLQGVLGLNTVRNELRIQSEFDAAERSAALPPLERRVPIAQPEVPSVSRSQEAMSRRPASADADVDTAPAWRPVEALPTKNPLPNPAPAPLAEPAPTLQWRPKESRPSLPVNAPKALPQTPSIRVPTSAAESAPVEQRSSPTSQTLDRIRTVRDGDRRFRQLNPSLADGVVTIRGQVLRDADLDEFARTISRIAGVQRMILQATVLEPGP